MRAEQSKFFGDLLEKNKRIFKVPVYQRNYDWSGEQCEKLYKDIMSASKRNRQHFTGTVVYITDVDRGSGLNEVLIIDGQQRITTVYILLKALYESSENVSYRIESELKDVMFNRNCDDKYKVKLKPVKSDNEQLQLLLKNEIEKMNKNSNVYKNFVTFKRLIEETVSEGFELSDILEGIKKLEIVEIILDKNQGDEPQKIFESINSTGLELSLADLVRNYLLMDDKNQDELYSKYWVELEKNVGYENLRNFIIKFVDAQVKNSVNSKNAYDLFKKHCENNKLTHEDVLFKLERTSKCYGAFVGANQFYSKRIQDDLHAFCAIKQTTVLPLIFKIFDDFEDGNINEYEVCKVLEYLFTYILRVIVCETGKSLSGFFKSLYSRVIKDDFVNYSEKFIGFLNGLNSQSRIPSDEEFREAVIHKPLYNNKHVCRYILSVIENSSKEKIDLKNLTIEHILPQKENSRIWRKEIGEDYSRVRETYLHTLGNLTITGYNSELGTKPFKEKKKIISEHSKANILNEKILDVDTWNEKNILRRAESLSEKLISMYPYVESSVDVFTKDEPCIGISEYYDFSGTTPSGFSFMGEFVRVKNWVNLLTEFIELSYGLDSRILINLANKNFIVEGCSSVYLTHDKRLLRKPREIFNNGIFYESNLSANAIISFIKELILNMDLDPDEFEVYLENKDIDTNKSLEWVNWDSDFNPSFKDVVEFEIKGKRIKPEKGKKDINFKDVFIKVNEFLYKENPFVYTESNFIWVSSDGKSMTSPYSLGENVYIETNRSNEVNFENISAVAKLMGLDSKDIKFLFKERECKGSNKR